MRQPFVYPTGCTGPVVDIDFGFTVCGDLDFTAPIYTHVPRIDPPDANPPPFCPCIPTIFPRYATVITGESGTAVSFTGKATSIFGGSTGMFDIKIVPMTADCCNPDYKFEFDLRVPCMPFSMVVTSSFPTGVPPPRTGHTGDHLRIAKDPATCRFLFNLSLPPGFSPDKYGIVLFEKGEGVKFIPCCSGTGYIGLDATMFFDSEENRWFFGLIHEVNLKIPLLAKLEDYNEQACDDLLDPATQRMLDPWGAPVEWKSNSNVQNPVLKYSKKQPD